MRRRLMFIMMAISLCGISKAQGQVEEVIIEQNLPGYKTSFEANPFWHNWFISANVGGNTLLKQHSLKTEFKNTITLMPQLSVGKMFNPWWGIRLQGGGGSLHGFSGDPEKMTSMHYVNANIDFMLGLFNFFGSYKPDRVFDIVPFFGIGGMARKSKQSFTIHGGVQAKFRLSERFDANIECQGMVFNDKMIIESGLPNDGLAGVTAGITYRFKGRGFRRAPSRAVVEELALANLVLADQVYHLKNQPPVIQVIEKEVFVPVEEQDIIIETIIETMPTTIPFEFNSAIIKDIYDPFLYNIATFMIKYPESKICIIGYADKFGPINVNMRISKERADAVASSLEKDYGICPSRMEIKYVGKEKPYYQNDNKWNRCVMIEIIP